jgi:hypothetical protein
MPPFSHLKFHLLPTSSRPGDVVDRAKCEKEFVRRTSLEEDPYIGEVGPHHVLCKACGTIIRLDLTYKYELSHWRAHRARCAQIPFKERVPEKPKRRQFGYQKKRHYQEKIVSADFNDSDDSDASSMPRPSPTVVFTAPLEINVSQMFLPRAPFPATHTVDAAKAKHEAELLARLEVLANNLSTSERLAEIIHAAGDGITTEEKLAKEHGRVADLEACDSDDDAVRDDEAQFRQPSPTPDPDAWIPRKRTREEKAEFDAFFNKMPRPESPIPSSKLQVCKLDQEALKIIE